MSGKLSSSVARRCAILVLCVAQINASAIPMWEYLSRGEKMSHLFNMFVQQVDKHCSEHQQSEPDCSKLLLVYGLTKLASMADQSLDDMDPYQRDANKIVWDSMMEGHEHHTKQKESGQSVDELEDMNAGDEIGAASSVHETQSAPQSFLLGPMVVRVLPNGMPIPGEKNDLPKDEDVEEFAGSKYNMEELAKQISSSTTTSTTTTARPFPTTASRRADRYNHHYYQPLPYRTAPQQRLYQPFETTRVRSQVYPVFP